MGNSLSATSSHSSDSGFLDEGQAQNDSTASPLSLISGPPVDDGSPTPLTRLLSRESAPGLENEHNPRLVSEADLWDAYREAVRDGDPSRVESTRNELLVKYSPFVMDIAQKLHRTLQKSVQVDDLFSDGLFGLVDAIGSFDPERGVRFRSYSYRRIRGAMIDELRVNEWTPFHVQTEVNKLQKASDALTSKLRREPLEFELADSLGVSLEQLRRVQSARKTRSMYSASSGVDESEQGKTISFDRCIDPSIPTPIVSLGTQDLSQFVKRNLTERERFVFDYYYIAGISYRAIGERLDVTESRICQIHSEALTKLQLLHQSQSDLAAECLENSGSDSF